MLLIKGLNKKPIKEFWREVRVNGVNYNIREFNCSTVVAVALYAGCRMAPSFQSIVSPDDYISGDFSKFLARLFLGDKVEAWSSEQVLRYAKEIKRKI